MIGIDRNYLLYYEGSSKYGHAIWPSPVASIATLIASDSDWKNIPDRDDLGTAKLVFREDFFDPVTRIRRGRIYQACGAQPSVWHVQRHPAYHSESGHLDAIKKELYGFDNWQPDPQLRGNLRKVVVALGINDAHSLWNIIGVERISSGEDLVTLKARSFLGTVPELDMAKIPEYGRQQISSLIDRVADVAYRAGTESIIDRCRDAGQAIFGVWMAEFYSDQKLREKDIGPLLQKLGTEGKERYLVLCNSVSSIARLHARAKPNEQITGDRRIPTDGDAECAIALVGLLLRELGWTVI